MITNRYPHGKPPASEAKVRALLLRCRHFACNLVDIISFAIANVRSYIVLSNALPQRSQSPLLGQIRSTKRENLKANENSIIGERNTVLCTAGFPRVGRGQMRSIKATFKPIRCQVKPILVIQIVVVIDRLYLLAELAFAYSNFQSPWSDSRLG